ncbi:MAG: hypothetical protein GY764_01975 [Halieaceae bacterium]|nr:hypothetical protein [Halieaceae bacterium]MCP4465712.1 hypothetical protein [Halieaceae bacterium]MCP4840864.1 hypothetical protein [Halieaceae bacterium]MDG2411829.1 hypothetical protein [Halioglobus sp.]
MKFVKLAAATALIAASATTLAARPTSIVFDSNSADSEGNAYAKYIVKCSNGKKAELTAWNNRKKWCVGDASSDTCEKKQINAAKGACKAR